MCFRDERQTFILGFSFPIFQFRLTLALETKHRAVPLSFIYVIVLYRKYEVEANT